MELVQYKKAYSGEMLELSFNTEDDDLSEILFQKVYMIFLSI